LNSLRDLYPPIEPSASGFLDVDSLHRVYWEECGNPRGVPVVFLHGGPGGGSSATSRRFFDPVRFRIVLLDQRGAGRSTPNGETRANTTADLIRDLETLRQARGIERWHLFGGSWGSTLALAYAQEHPECCLSLVLRGIFLMRESEIRWIFEAGRLFRPEALQALAHDLPAGADLLREYAALLEHPDPALRLAAARRWSVFEAMLANLTPEPGRLAGATDARVAYAMARIELHYFLNNRYTPEDHLLQRMSRIAHLPGVIVQGRYDLLCPPVSALQLQSAWPGSRLIVVEGAGHSATEPGIRSVLIETLDAIAAGG
jgi:proline iminopeptidase